MISYDNIVELNGYLVHKDTKEKVVFYVCDPAKNTSCPHGICRMLDSAEDEGSFGFCNKTMHEQFKKDGTKPFYAVLKEDTYWGREYIDK